jgi:hypothetical protein
MYHQIADETKSPRKSPVKNSTAAIAKPLQLDDKEMTDFNG